MKAYVTKLICIMTAVLLVLGLLGCTTFNSSSDYAAYGAAGSAVDGPSGTEAKTGADSGYESASAPATSILIQSSSEDEPRSDVTFSQIVYTRPDLDAMSEKMDALKEDIRNGTDAAAMIEDYITLQEDYAHADSMLSLAYLLYAFDVTQSYYRDEYAYLQSTLGDLDAQMEGVSVALFESSDEAKSLAEQAFGTDYVEDVLRADDMTDTSVTDLLSSEERLTLFYDNLCATFTLEDGGKSWTLDEITSDYSLSYDEYLRLYDAYCAALNAKAGDIFLQQLKLREQIASRLGYDTYTDYCYDSYGRDYTPEEARSLHAAVKQYIAPVFIYVNDRSDSYKLADVTFSDQVFLTKLSNAAKDFSPMLSEPVEYMLRNGLYDFSYAATKMDSSFTTYFSDYRAPFIFMEWTGDSTDVMTALHELGHFTSYYHNAAVGYSAVDNLDLAEIDSQALVLLMTQYFDSFFGKYEQEATTGVLLDAMYALLSGCMEDEFQQDVYENPDMTLNEMNTLYKQLAVEYGLDDVYGYTGTEWVLVSHTFQSPLYYISYAVSIVPALELYELSQKDEDAAKDAYFSILKRNPYASFKDVLEENGLSSVFSDSTIQRIADIVDKNT